jgi:hypothetical protein
MRRVLYCWWPTERSASARVHIGLSIVDVCAPLYGGRQGAEVDVPRKDHLEAMSFERLFEQRQ